VALVKHDLLGCDSNTDLMRSNQREAAVCQPELEPLSDNQKPIEGKLFLDV